MKRLIGQMLCMGDENKADGVGDHGASAENADANGGAIAQRLSAHIKDESVAAFAAVLFGNNDLQPLADCTESELASWVTSR